MSIRMSDDDYNINNDDAIEYDDDYNDDEYYYE